MAYTKKDTAKTENIKTKEKVADSKVETKEEVIEAKVEEVSVEEPVVDNKNIELQNQVLELQELVKKLMAEKAAAPTVQVIDTSSRMDKPCTLIHLIECPNDLPTSINVNGNPHYFHSFGERKTFRFADMQTITTKYRDWFARGIFTLGEDCNDMQDEFGVEVTKIPMSVDTYKKIASLDLDRFTDLVNGMNKNQQVLLAKTWIQRNVSGQHGYDDLNKMTILNKATQGMLKSILQDAVQEV